MKVAELADRVASVHELPRAEAKRIVETMLKAIAETAASGTEVSLAGFGKFKVQDRPPRQGRNPRTGETVEIAATRKLAFAPAKALKDALNG